MDDILVYLIVIPITITMLHLVDKLLEIKRIKEKERDIYWRAMERGNLEALEDFCKVARGEKTRSEIKTQIQHQHDEFEKMKKEEEAKEMRMREIDAGSERLRRENDALRNRLRFYENLNTPPPPIYDEKEKR